MERLQAPQHICRFLHYLEIFRRLPEDHHQFRFPLPCLSSRQRLALCLNAPVAASRVSAAPLLAEMAGKRWSARNHGVPAAVVAPQHPS